MIQPQQPAKLMVVMMMVGGEVTAGRPDDDVDFDWWPWIGWKQWEWSFTIADVAQQSLLMVQQQISAPKVYADLWRCSLWRTQVHRILKKRKGEWYPAPLSWFGFGFYSAHWDWFFVSSFRFLSWSMSSKHNESTMHHRWRWCLKVRMCRKWVSRASLSDAILAASVFWRTEQRCKWWWCLFNCQIRNLFEVICAGWKLANNERILSILRLSVFSNSLSALFT